MSKSWLLGQTAIVWMIGAHLLSLVLLYREVSWWVVIFSLIAIGWRWMYFKGKAMVFNRYLLLLICLVSVVLLAITAAGNGLLATMVNLMLLGYGLKFIELKVRRDMFVLALVGFITIGVIIIYHNDVTSALKVVPLLIINTGILLIACAPSLGWRKMLAESCRILGASVPLMLVLFFLMPQLAPLWKMPSLNTAVTGLSDQMSPGEIAQLSHSDDLAFSVTFDPPQARDLSQTPKAVPPPRNQLYWRALVMEAFDGQRWSQIPAQQQWQERAALSLPSRLPPLPKSGGISYQVIAKASQQSWLYGLALPVSTSDDVRLTLDLNLYATQPLVSTRMYQVTSYPSLMTQIGLSDVSRAVNLRVNDGLNLKTMRWARELRHNNPDAGDFIAAVLRHFNRQNFFYTLYPPLLGENSVDDFLFSTRRGFCSHYASAFSLIMRYGGIPSRVVAGYQGGEWNQDVGYLNVYQYDAHAWNEVWLPGRGWVRFDPTASVSPQRIELGLARAMMSEQSFLSDSLLSLAKYQDSPWLNQLRLSLANIDYYWSRWLLGYDRELQHKLLKALLGQVTTARLLSLSLGCFIVIGLWLLWHSGFRIKRLNYSQKIDKLYYRISIKLAEKGVARASHMGAADYCDLVIRMLPDTKREMTEFTRCYNDLKYSQTKPATRDDLLAISALAKPLLKKI